MSTIKKCKRCVYNKEVYKIDYRISAQEQKIYYSRVKVCKNCNYIKPKQDFEYIKAELDNYPSDMNVDLSKIIHEHNHNKIGDNYGDLEIKKIYDNNKLIKLILINHCRCDFCNKKMNYYIIKEEYELNKLNGDMIKIKNILNKIPKNAINCNINNSEIEHIHNHNKFDYAETQDKIFNNNDKLIKLILINHYQCDFCNKKMDYTEKKEYDINNLKKDELEHLQQIMHKITNVCPETWKKFERKEEWFDNIRPFVYEDNWHVITVCSECGSCL